MSVLLLLQALIAGGTYNGELVIWDLKKPDADAQVLSGIVKGTTNTLDILFVTKHAVVFFKST